MIEIHFLGNVGWYISIPTLNLCQQEQIAELFNINCEDYIKLMKKYKAFCFSNGKIFDDINGHPNNPDIYEYFFPNIECAEKFLQSEELKKFKIPQILDSYIVAYKLSN